MLRKISLTGLALTTLVLSGPARADDAATRLQIATDIAPVHSLAAQVAGDLADVSLLVRPGTSPHGYALRPSEARHLQNADIVLWIGEENTAWLTRSISNLAPDALSIPLLDVPGTTVLPWRDRAVFSHDAEHDDHNDHDEHDDHDDHDDHAAHDDHDKDDHDEHGKEDHDEGHEDHDGHEDHADHKEDGHDDHKHEEDGHDEDGHDEHAHDHGNVDPHAWLDPMNADHWLDLIANTLAKADPANSQAYFDNASAAMARNDNLRNRINATLAPVRGRAFVTGHDALQYFEARFDMPSSAAITSADDTAPGAARFAALRDALNAGGVACLFVDPSSNQRLANTLIEGTQTRIATIDGLGVAIETGPGFYDAMMSGIATAMADCLSR